MDRFKFFGFALIFVGAILGCSLAFYDLYWNSKPDPKILGASDVRRQLVKSAQQEAKQQNVEIKILGNSNTQAFDVNILKPLVSDGCNATINAFKDYTWQISPSDKMILSPTEQILILQCDYSQKPIHNVFYHNSAANQTKLLKFDIFDNDQKSMTKTSDVLFSPANNYPYPNKFSGLINGKTGYDCGELLYYSWRDTNQSYNLDKAKSQSCDKAKLGIVNDYYWETIYPAMEK
jgi:hypothetical protein